MRPSLAPQSAPWLGRMEQQLREHLIRTQATRGHEAGSWHFSDRWGDVGGRLYDCNVRHDPGNLLSIHATVW